MFDSESSLLDDRREGFALQIFVVVGQGDAEMRFIRMLENIMAARGVMDEEACFTESPQNFPGLRSGQALAHAGMATLIFSLTGSAVSLGSLGIGSPSLRKLSRYA